ncbi:MAG: YwaF family protein [Clostridiales bacterium]|nr:YwaF family protein [Clostridiales bacterium]
MFWTSLHAYTLIPQFVVYIALAFVLSRALKNKDRESQLLPLKICTVLLLVLEAAKQIMGIVTGYSTYWIPLHFCSLFLYFHPLACFCKGKLRERFILIAGVVSTCLFLFMAVYPNIIYSDDAIRSMWNYLTGRGGSFFELHTVLFHGIGTFTFFLFMFQGLIRFNTRKDVVTVVITYGLYCLIVAPVAQLIDTNFNNFVHSNAPFLENIRLSMIESTGAFAGQTVYVLILSVGTILVPLIAYFILKWTTGLFGLKKSDRD